MNSTELEFYNKYFDQLANIKKQKDFQFISETKQYEGLIHFTSKNGKLSFLVQIPQSYPLISLKFVTNDFEGYPHQNLDGSLCLNTPFVNHVYTSLNLEIEKLRGYVTRYYEEEREDQHYEYSPFQSKGSVTFIFDEKNFDSSRFDTPFGDFKYSILNCNTDNTNTITHFTAIAQSIANKNYFWSKNYQKQRTYTGCWVFLEREPVHKKKHRFTSWKDLAPLLPEGFSDFLKNFCKRLANYKLIPARAEQNILLAIGYKIPIANSFEMHWDMVLLPRSDFSRKFKATNSSIHNYEKPVLWEATYNASYERFFGRGAVDKSLANKKTLIIGLGAIGSSLAEILTRGGASTIDLSDVDIIEAGNVCRSVYNFNDICFNKAATLRDKLRSISPFVDVSIVENIEAASLRNGSMKDMYERLAIYDVIYDCTANNEIVQILTNFRLAGTVFYISISNKAKEMVCVCNKDNTNIIGRRNQMLYSFGDYRASEYREGTGCWHPTFEASYFDINQLLNYTIKKINSFYKISCDPKTFYSYFREESVKCSEDVKYFQSELNLSLTIESKCLEKIEHYSREHFPNEFGGCLLGSYLNDYREVVISEIIYPDKFHSTTMKFEPNPFDLNKKLNKVYSEFEGRIEYVGDWHSHPNSSNHFSESDFRSISDVAQSKTVNTHNPILVIAAFGPNYFDPGFYVYKSYKLYKFKRN
jgi:proteasome lid subunit RPN8/RPN11